MKKHWLNNNYDKCVVVSDDNKIISVKLLSITDAVVNICGGSKEFPFKTKDHIIQIAPKNSFKKLQKKLNEYVGKTVNKFKEDVSVLGWTAWKDSVLD